MAESNKVKFGIRNCFYSVISENPDGTINYATPKPFPGAVSLSLDPSGGDSEKFYADDGVYYQTAATNSGYEGDFEVARVIDDFHIDVLGLAVDGNGMMVEDADAVSKSFALLVQFSGDKENTRHVLYNCTATRPAFASSTIEETRTPQTETITINAIPAPFGERRIVKAKVTPTDPVYANFFDAVVTPDFTPGAPQVVLSDSNIRLVEGTKRVVTAAVTPTGTPVVWTCDDTTVATVNNGEITAVAAGTATVTATITVDSVDYTDTCAVTVVPAV